MLTRAGLKPVEITFQDMGRNLLKHLTAEVLSRCFFYIYQKHHSCTQMFNPMLTHAAHRDGILSQQM